MIDARWQKWISASINKHFESGWDALAATDRDLASTAKYFEGQDIQLQGNDWFEVRVDGPRYTELSRNQVMTDITINVMVTCKKGQDAYRIHKLAGVIQSLFDAIPVLTYGTSNPTLIDCLQRKSQLRTNSWGEMTVDLGNAPLRVMNISVEADYAGNLTYSG